MTSGDWTTEYHKGVGFSYKTTARLFKEQSPYQLVEVIETDTYGTMLLLDGVVMTTEKDEFVYHEMITHVPLLAHPNPKRVLVIGGGDGGTVREIVKHPSVQEVILCEIDNVVIEASKQFLPSIACALEHPKVTVNVGDGIAYMANEARDFDVIIIDSTDPIGPGEGLFTEEFYQHTANALTPQGIMVAQTESLFLDQDIIQTIYPMYQRIFPVVHMYTGNVATYPAGYWSWCFCSKGTQPHLTKEAKERAQIIEPTCKYYNSNIHEASFALSNFARQLVTPNVKVEA